MNCERAPSSGRYADTLWAAVLAGLPIGALATLMPVKGDLLDRLWQSLCFLILIGGSVRIIHSVGLRYISKDHVVIKETRTPNIVHVKWSRQ